MGISVQMYCVLPFYLSHTTIRILFLCSQLGRRKKINCDYNFNEAEFIISRIILWISINPRSPRHSTELFKDSVVLPKCHQKKDISWHNRHMRASISLLPKFISLYMTFPSKFSFKNFILRNNLWGSSYFQVKIVTLLWASTPSSKRIKREAHTYGWFMLLSDRKQWNSEKQLSFN